MDAVVLFFTRKKSTSVGAEVTLAPVLSFFFRDERSFVQRQVSSDTFRALMSFLVSFAAASNCLVCSALVSSEHLDSPVVRALAAH